MTVQETWSLVLSEFAFLFWAEMDSADRECLTSQAVRRIWIVGCGCSPGKRYQRIQTCLTRELNRPPLHPALGAGCEISKEGWTSARQDSGCEISGEGWTSAGQDSGCEISGEGGTSAGQNSRCEISGEGGTSAEQNSSPGGMISK